LHVLDICKRLERSEWQLLPDSYLGARTITPLHLIHLLLVLAPSLHFYRQSALSSQIRLVDIGTSPSSVEPRMT
jgi:hypothetical protein